MSRVLVYLAAIALSVALARAEPANAAELRPEGLRANPAAQTQLSVMQSHWYRRRIVVYRHFWGPRYGFYPWVPRYAYYPYWRPY